jgi:hypothetical protein
MGSPQHRISSARESQSANFRNPKRKKIQTRPRLPCKIQYLLTSNHRDKSSASEFFTDDQIVARMASLSARIVATATLA